MKFNSGNGNSFLKINDKESVVGIFRGEPYEYRQHWVNKKGELCPGEGCEHCAAGEKPGFRFRLNFVTYDAVDYKAWIIEQGWNFYTDLKGLHEGDYDLEKTLVKITRNGTGNMTKYTILPVANRVLTEQEMARIGAVKLLKLEKDEERSQAPAQSEHMQSLSDMSEQDIPF